MPDIIALCLVNHNLQFSLRVKRLARQKNSIDESNLVAYTDARQLEKAYGLYIANCAACHGPEGQGGVGPNMTDNYWIHGGSISDVYQTIKNAVTCVVM